MLSLLHVQFVRIHWSQIKPQPFNVQVICSLVALVTILITFDYVFKLVQHTINKKRNK